MSFQVWGPGRQQFPGDDGRPALLEHMAPTSVLTGQQEEGQGIPPANHQHHQQDREQEAGAMGTRARVLGGLTLRPGQTHRKRQPRLASHRGCLPWGLTGTWPLWDTTFTRHNSHRLRPQPDTAHIGHDLYQTATSERLLGIAAFSRSQRGRRFLANLSGGL